MCRHCVTRLGRASEWVRGTRTAVCIYVVTDSARCQACSLVLLRPQIRLSTGLCLFEFHGYGPEDEAIIVCKDGGQSRLLKQRCVHKSFAHSGTRSYDLANLSREDRNDEVVASRIRPCVDTPYLRSARASRISAISNTCNTL